MTEQIVAWAKANAKEGANVAELEELTSKLALPNTKEEAWNFIKKNQAFKSAVDAEVSRATAAHDVNFRETRLPDIEKELRDQLMKELNPQETPQDKKIRELSEKLEAKERAEKKAILREAKRKWAGEKNFDPDLAAELAELGANDDEVFERFAEKYQNALNARVEDEIKKRFGGNPEPKTGVTTPADMQAKYNELLRQGKREEANLIYLQMTRAKKE